MASTIKNIVFASSVLAFALLADVNLASAVPAVGSLSLDTAHALAAHNGSVNGGCPASQPPNRAGCSKCTECCIMEFNNAGCGKTSAEELAMTQPIICYGLASGMKNVWVTECTGLFAECTLWKNDDCTGKGSLSITNDKDVCHQTQYWINSISCL